ncbi:MAG: hypothetical protein WAX38_04575 [Minisyncoccia bacterium]
MSSTVYMTLALLLIGVYFCYIGFSTLWSKKYYINNIESVKENSVNESYLSLPKWRLAYTRYSLGIQWLVIGVASVSLSLYGFWKILII